MKIWISRILVVLLALVLVTVLGVLCLLLLPVPALPQPPADQGPLLLTNGWVVDVEKDTLRREDVLIAKGTIVQVGSIERSALGREVQVIDVTGQYLIPGLWDMHVHLAPHMASHLTFPLFIAHGVTNVREMGGARYQELKQLDQQIRANQVVGPRFQGITGLFLDFIEDEAAMRTSIQAFPGTAPDHIKVYTRVLPEVYGPLMEAAEEQSIPALGHRPRAVEAIVASEAGQVSFEHAQVFLFECYPGAAALRAAFREEYLGREKAPYNTAELRRMIDTHSDSMFAELASTMAKNGTWFCPTHLTRKMDALADDPDYRHDPRLRYQSPLQQLYWNSDADGMIAKDPSPEGRQTYLDFYLKGLALTGKAHQAGVQILAGTDANDTYCFPGSGLHDELEELVKAGLSPVEALRCATTQPAAYYEVGDHYGSIDAGKVADLVVLEQNPLADIGHVRSIQAVIFNGQYYERSTLDALLLQVEQFAKSWAINTQLVWRMVTNP